MSDQISIEPKPDSSIFLKDVTVRYRVSDEPIHTFKEYIIRIIQGKLQHHAFFAIKNISLDIKRGEIFGVLGRNGAGKSTLLKVVSRVLIPSEGRVWIKGNISPLLQLGAGFHPELTGLENIYLNATILGHAKNEIEKKIDDIIDFSEIGEFINVPLRTYSSGMRARLGFAVATAWRPDILILDEVLAVGDVAFREKCVERMNDFRDSGATVLIVSHSIESINELCQRAMWLDQGIIQKIGPSEEVSSEYRQAMREKRRKNMSTHR